MGCCWNRTSVYLCIGSFPRCALRCSSKGELDLAHCCVARWRASGSYLLLYKRPLTRSLASSWPHLVCDQYAATNRCYSDMVIVRPNVGSILLFNRQHPQALLRRLYEISFAFRPGVPFREIASEFVRRYLEDQSLYALLLTGDYHPRHHVQGSGGALLCATFILAMIGLLLVFTRDWRDPWWRFVAYGLAASIVPGALTNEPFHQLRLMAYPVFLLVLLTVPTLEWLLAPIRRRKAEKKEVVKRSTDSNSKRGLEGYDARPASVFFFFC